MSCRDFITWWRHQMETFYALLALCAGNSPVIGELPPRRPVTRSFDVFFDLCINKRLYKQSIHRWFETPSRSLWRHCNGSDNCNERYHAANIYVLLILFDFTIWLSVLSNGRDTTESTSFTFQDDELSLPVQNKKKTYPWHVWETFVKHSLRYLLA